MSQNKAIAVSRFTRLGLLVCFILLLSLSGRLTPLAVAEELKQKYVILLTSVDFEKEAASSIFASSAANMSRKLSRMFTSAFKNTPYTVGIVHRANQVLLNQALQNPQVAAVFWLSHAGSSDIGALENDVIVDANSFDLLPVFKNAGPQLKVLALVGCNTERGANKIFDEAFKASHPQTMVKTFNRKIEINAGLALAIKDSKSALGLENTAHNDSDNPKEYQPEYPSKSSVGSSTTQTIKISLTRILSPIDRRDQESKSLAYPSLRIENQNKIVGFFESSDGSEAGQQVINLEISINRRGFRVNDLKILITSGDYFGSGEVNLGDFSINSSNAPGSWIMLTTPAGKPLGVTTRIFKFKPRG